METRKQKKQQKNAALTFVCIGAMTSAVHGQHFQAALIAKAQVWCVREKINEQYFTKMTI